MTPRGRTRVISLKGSEAGRVKARLRRARIRRVGVRVAAVAVVVSIVGGFCAGRFDRAEGWIAHGLYSESARLGLRVSDVALEGRKFTSRDEIMSALTVRQGDPILAFDPAAARHTLEALPRIASADVTRRLPGTVLVRISERTPVAIWQRNGRTVLIDRDGVVLGDTKVADYRSLPVLVGEGADKAAGQVLAFIAAEPALAKRIGFFIRVGERRWDLKMDNGVDVKLPETGEASALHRLAEVEEKNGLLEHDVVTVDLRLPGKLIVATSQPRDPKKKPAPQQGI